MGENKSTEHSEQGPSSKLVSGINLDQLLKTNEATFEVRPVEDIELDLEDKRSSFFDKKLVENEFLNDGIALGVDNESDESDSELSSLTPFEKIEKKGVDITDGKKLIFKLVKSEGSGPVVPENSTVRVHYYATVEHQDAPFDSTHLRDRPMQFRLNNGEVLPGLDMSVATMKRREVSYFLIRPELAFREMGCGQRIPRNSTLLFKVELLDIVDDVAAAQFRNLAISEREKLSFEQICQVSRGEREAGNNCFKQGQYRKALGCYKRATKMLEDFHLKDADEERVQQKILLKLYLNLSMCFIKLNKFPPAVTHSNLALEIDQKSVKALYRKGIAFKMMNSYEKANRCFKEAAKYEPQNQEIVQEQKNIDMMLNQSRNAEKAMYQKMFSRPVDKTEVKKDEGTKSMSVSKEFEEKFAEKMIELKDSNENIDFFLPANLTPDEHSLAVYVAKEVGLRVFKSKVGGRLVTKISK